MTAVVAILVLAALVWGLVYLVRGSLIAGCLLYLVTTACFNHPFWHLDLGSIPITADRLVLLAVLAAYGVQRWLGKTEPKPPTRGDYVLLTLLLTMALSASAVGWAGVFSDRWITIYRFLGGYCMPVVVYWIARQAPLGRREVALVHGTLLVFGVYLSLTGIAEITRQWWAVFPTHIADPKVGLHFGRARGPMVHGVTFGLYASICCLASWAFRWRLGPRAKMLLLPVSGLLLVGTVLSLTRSVWIGTALAVTVLLALSLRGRVRMLVLGTIALSGLTVLLGGFEQVAHFQREDSADDSRRSVSMRGCFAYVSWQMFLDRPLFGFGFGQFPEAKLPYLSDRSTDLQLEAIRDYIHHNTFLSLLTETGLVGLTLYLALLFLWGRTAWQLARRPAAPDWARAQALLFLAALTVYVVQGVFHELSYTPIDNSLIFLLAGVTVGLAQSPALAGASAPARATWPAAPAYVLSGPAAHPLQ